MRILLYGSTPSYYDSLQLFQQEPSNVPAVPVSSGSQQAAASPSGGHNSQGAPDSPNAQNLNTLDEPVWHTIKRDLIRIYGNLVLVVFPFKNRDQQTAALRNWDLWGPMVCARLLCCFECQILPQAMLSAPAQVPSPL